MYPPGHQKCGKDVVHCKSGRGLDHSGGKDFQKEGKDRVLRVKGKEEERDLSKRKGKGLKGKQYKLKGQGKET